MMLSRTLLLASIACAGLLLPLSAQSQDTPTNTVSTIDWEKARVDARASGLSVGRLRVRDEDVDLVALPVLVPRQAIGQLKVSTRKNLYTARFKDGAVTVLITGTSIVFVPPASAPAPTFDGKDVRIERTEIGVDVNFSRYGAAYQITIACDEPETDPRCKEDTYANEILSSLAVVLSTSQGTPQ